MLCCFRSGPQTHSAAQAAADGGCLLTASVLFRAMGSGEIFLILGAGTAAFLILSIGLFLAARRRSGEKGLKFETAEFGEHRRQD